MQQVLYSEGGMSMTLKDTIHLEKNQDFNIQMPHYCTDARYNHKQYL